MTSSKGEADADDGVVVAGQFTMPDLGGTAKSVQVEAELRDDDDDKTTVKRKLQYLGHAPPVTVVPAAPAQVTTPAASPHPVQEPASEPTPGAAKAPDEPGAVARRAKRKRRQARERRAARRRDTTSKQSQRRSKSQRQDRSDRPARAKTKRRKGDAPRTAPLFDGVPEPQTGGYAAPDDGESAKAPQQASHPQPLSPARWPANRQTSPPPPSSSLGCSGLRDSSSRAPFSCASAVRVSRARVIAARTSRCRPGR